MNDVCSDRFCSLASQSAGEDPVGTAGSYDRIVMIECRMPWPYDIRTSPHLPEGLIDTMTAAMEAASGTVFLFFSSDEKGAAERRDDGRRRVISFERPPGLSPGYARDEFRVPDELLPTLVEFLAGLAPESKEALLTPFREPDSAARDVFVCTHGAVDAACAKFGYPVYWSLVNRHAPQANGALRVWRGSHFGGHRFAGALLDLPTGHWWGHLNPAALAAIANRTGPTQHLKRHYRGWGGAGHPFVQAAEREIWAREGWKWMEYGKSGELLDEEDGATRGRVRISYRSPDGAASGAYEATVTVSHYVRVPLKTGGACREVPQYKVESLTRARRCST